MIAGFKYILLVVMVLFFQAGWAQKGVLDSVIKNNGNDSSVYLNEVIEDEESYIDTGVTSIRENIINDTFYWKHLQDSTVTALKNSKDFEYANDSTYWKRPKPKQHENENSNDSFSGKIPDWVSAVGIILVVLVLLFVVYRLVVNNSLFEFGSKKPIDQPEIDLSEEGLNADNINDRLKLAEAEKNYVLYLRLSYIRTLFLLNETGDIHYDKQTTNAQYVFKMRNHRLYNEFRKLTYLNDYITYGGFEISESQFLKLKEDFVEFNRKLNL